MAVNTLIAISLNSYAIPPSFGVPKFYKVLTAVNLTVSEQVDETYQPTNRISIGRPGFYLTPRPLVIGISATVPLPRPPLVWLVNAARLDDHPKNDGHILQEATFTNLNDKMVLDIDSGTIIGRSDLLRGPAQRIQIMSPLKIENSMLMIDLAALFALIKSLQQQIDDLKKKQDEQRWI